jgi:D-arabinose 1-dehydrogenase-like Zn-dependent alcohol dehydrogenase
LTLEGIYVLVGGGTAQFFHAMLLSMTGNKKMVTFIKKTNKQDLVFMKDLLEAGKVVPAIDRCYPLSEVPEAIRYLEKGHAKGKVVVTVN